MSILCCRSVTAVLLVAVLAACQSSTGAAPSPTVYEQSPLAEYVSLLGLSRDEQAEISRQAEDLIAQCMKDEGFSYDQPYVPDQAAQGSEDMDLQEWTAVYGYGISTRSDDTVSLDASDRSSADQAAYDQALYGTESEGGYDWEQQGCMGRAYHEATGGADEVMRDARYAVLFDAISAVEAEVAASDEVGGLNAAWSRCMAEAGRPDLAQPSDAPLSVHTALAELRAGQTDPDSPVVAMATLREDEIALALADLSCQDKVDYTARYDQVLWAAQAALVADYLPELEALARDDG